MRLQLGRLDWTCCEPAALTRPAWPAGMDRRRARAVRMHSLGGGCSDSRGLCLPLLARTMNLAGAFFQKSLAPGEGGNEGIRRRDISRDAQQRPAAMHVVVSLTCHTCHPRRGLIVCILPLPRRKPHTRHPILPWAACLCCRSPGSPCFSRAAASHDRIRFHTPLSRARLMLPLCKAANSTVGRAFASTSF